MRPLWAGLCVVGTVVPLAVFGPWLLRHGPDIGLLYAQASNSSIAAFAWLDVLISAVAVLALALKQVAAGQKRYWWVVLGTCAVGVSLGLPLYLFLADGVGRAGAVEHA